MNDSDNAAYSAGRASVLGDFRTTQVWVVAYVATLYAEIATDRLFLTITSAQEWIENHPESGTSKREALTLDDYLKRRYSFGVSWGRARAKAEM